MPGTPDGLLLLGPPQIAVALAGLGVLARAVLPSRE